MKVKKIKKLKRKKKFNQNVNRKRLRNKLKKLPNIPCDEIKKAWEHTKSTRINLKHMGLAYDANEVIKIPNAKQEKLEDIKKKVTGNEDQQDKKENRIMKKNFVAKKLEADAKTPRERLFKLPKGQAEFLTYLIKKYGEDYKAMSRDKKNHYQLTWKQIRAKIKMFKGIPEQYTKFMQNNEQLESEHT